jgi:hypothetical protein
MASKRHLVKSCCGSVAYLFEISQPVTPKTLDFFKHAGYTTSEIHQKIGVFFVEKQGLMATGPYGSNKIQVRCMSANCSQMLDAFDNTLTEAAIVADSK